MQVLDELDSTLSQPPALPEIYVKQEKSINGLIDGLIADLQKLKKAHM